MTRTTRTPAIQRGDEPGQSPPKPKEAKPKDVVNALTMLSWDEYKKQHGVSLRGEKLTEMMLQVPEWVAAGVTGDLAGMTLKSPRFRLKAGGDVRFLMEVLGAPKARHGPLTFKAGPSGPSGALLTLELRFEISGKKRPRRVR